MMSAPDTHEAAPGQGTPAVVRASRFVRVVMGLMTKALNPAMMKLAGRRHVRMAAQIRHAGCKSGRQYATPVGARLFGDTFVIPLTFGSQSDWSRNVRAAGGCSIRLNGVEYQVNRPELADWAQAGPSVRAAYSPAMRAMFRLLGIRQFMLLRLAGHCAQCRRAGIDVTAGRRVARARASAPSRQGGLRQLGPDNNQLGHFG